MASDRLKATGAAIGALSIAGVLGSKRFETPPTGEVRQEDGMTIRKFSGFDGPTWEQSINQTVELTNNNGRAPERMVARYLARNLYRLGINYDIRYGLQTHDPPSESAVCSADEPAFEWWTPVEDHIRPAALGKDGNILITNIHGGGCGYVGLRGCVGPGRFITEERDLVESGTGRYHRNLLGCLHEVGHNMGFRHDPHPGFGENDHLNGRWRRSPTLAGNDVQNLCGDYIPKREYNAVERILSYNDCVGERIQIEGAKTQTFEGEVISDTGEDW